MPKARTITLKTGRTQTELEVSDILYVLMDRNYANIHMEFGVFINPGLRLMS